MIYFLFLLVWTFITRYYFAKHVATQLILQNVNLFFTIKEYYGKTHLGNTALEKTKLLFFTQGFLIVFNVCCEFPRV